MRLLKYSLLAGASLLVLSAGAQAQVPMPGFYATAQGAYFWDSGPRDFEQDSGSGKIKTDDGFKLQGMLGYRFGGPWDIGVGGGYGWLSRGKADNDNGDRIKANYWTVDGTIGYTIDDGSGFAMRPFFGVRYVNFTHKTKDQVAPIWASDIDYWGIGPRVGIDLAYRFAGTAWYLGGTISGAATWGKISSDGTWPSGKSTRWAYNLDGQAGIGYEFSPGFSIMAGYQLDYWKNVNYTNEVNSSGKGDRFAHGPFLRLAYNFGVPALGVMPIAPVVPEVVPVTRFMVFFDWDRSNITPQAADTIRQAADAFRAGRNARIEATGHADRSGSDQYNMGLSLRRANAVKDALVRNGVPAAQIVVLGRGETMPLVQTADGVREPQNRRVEIVLQ